VLEREAVVSQDVGLSLSEAGDQLWIVPFEEPANPLHGLVGAVDLRLGEDGAQG
jgi:hypothetical protein